MLNFQELKLGFRLMSRCSRSIVAHCIITAVTLMVRINLYGDGFMSIEKGPAMASLPQKVSTFWHDVHTSEDVCPRCNKVSQGAWCCGPCRATGLGKLDGSVMLQPRQHFQGAWIWETRTVFGRMCPSEFCKQCP